MASRNPITTEEDFRKALGLLREAAAWIETGPEPAPSLCSDIRKLLEKYDGKPKTEGRY